MRKGNVWRFDTNWRNHGNSNLKDQAIFHLHYLSYIRLAYFYLPRSGIYYQYRQLYTHKEEKSNLGFLNLAVYYVEFTSKTFCLEPNLLMIEKLMNKLLYDQLLNR